MSAARVYKGLKSPSRRSVSFDRVAPGESRSEAPDSIYPQVTMIIGDSAPCRVGQLHFSRLLPYGNTLPVDRRAAIPAAARTPYPCLCRGGAWERPQHDRLPVLLGQRHGPSGQARGWREGARGRRNLCEDRVRCRCFPHPAHRNCG